MRISEYHLPPGVPPEALPHLRRVGYFQESPLDVGAKVPALLLFRADGAATPLESLYRERPAVLVFGSFT